MQLLDLLASAALAATVSAFNTDVHNQIGFMAEKFLTHETANILGRILEPTYTKSIGRAAAWADSYRKTTEGAYTYQWHWIDSLDTPPAVCNTYFNRDCTKGGCIVSAIANQSQILRDCIRSAKAHKLDNGANLTCSYALKFVTHFVSDLAQPLHTSNLGEGGNAFSVSWGGKTNNSVLHSIWDGAIIYSRANVSSFSNQTISPYHSALVDRIKADNFFEPTAKWTACTDPATPVAQDFTKPDLQKSGYFEGAYPIVELQMSKAALRLATWLNNLVAEKYDKKREVLLRVNPAWREL